MGSVWNTMGSVIGQFFFRIFFGIWPEVNNLISTVVWATQIRPMFRPNSACPDLLGGDAGHYNRMLEASLELNVFFLEYIVTPLILLGVLIIGILFLFGHLFDLREKLKDAMPKFMLAIILAYTSQVWMDVILALGRALMATVYDRIITVLAGHLLVNSIIGGSGSVSQSFGDQALYFIISTMLVMLVIAIGVSLAVRLGIVFTGISIMPIMSIFLGIPYIDEVGKKFIKLWIQVVFFTFWMAIPLILIKYAHGFVFFGLMVLALGMPFLVSTGEVLALRAGGMISGGGMAKMGIMGGQMGSMMKGGRAGPAGGMAGDLLSPAGGSSSGSGSSDSGGMDGKAGLLMTVLTGGGAGLLAGHFSGGSGNSGFAQTSLDQFGGGGSGDDKGVSEEDGARVAGAVASGGATEAVAAGEASQGGATSLDSFGGGAADEDGASDGGSPLDSYGGPTEPLDLDSGPMTDSQGSFLEMLRKDSGMNEDMPMPETKQGATDEIGSIFAAHRDLKEKYDDGGDA